MALSGIGSEMSPVVGLMETTERPSGASTVEGMVAQSRFLVGFATMPLTISRSWLIEFAVAWKSTLTSLKDELLAKFGSLATEEALAVQVRLPAESGVVTSEIVAVAPTARFPTSSETFKSETIGVPLLDTAETKVWLSESVTLMVVAAAGLGPLLVTWAV